MELLDTDLGKKIKDIKSDDWKLKLDIARKIMWGLRDIHQMKICHSDLKPSNILVSNDFNSVKIVDFGMSVISSLISVGGTPHYMAPEQAMKGTVSAKSD